MKVPWWRHNSAKIFRLVRQRMELLTSQLCICTVRSILWVLVVPKLILFFLLQMAKVPNLILFTWKWGQKYHLRSTSRTRSQPLILKCNIEVLRNAFKKIKPLLGTNFIGFCWNKNIKASKQDEFRILGLENMMWHKFNSPVSLCLVQWLWVSSQSCYRHESLWGMLAVLWHKKVPIIAPK